MEKRKGGFFLSTRYSDLVTISLLFKPLRTPSDGDLTLRGSENVFNYVACSGPLDHKNATTSKSLLIKS